MMELSVETIARKNYFFFLSIYNFWRLGVQGMCSFTFWSLVKNLKAVRSFSNQVVVNWTNEDKVEFRSGIYNFAVMRLGIYTIRGLTRFFLY